MEEVTKAGQPLEKWEGIQGIQPGKFSDTITLKHYRNGMLLNEKTQKMEGNCPLGATHRLLVEMAAGHDDRFVQTLTRSRGENGSVDTVSIHLYHLSDKVLIYVYTANGYNWNNLWVYQDGQEYPLGKIEETPKGLIVGRPVDDMGMVYPVEVPAAKVVKMVHDRITGEWQDVLPKI